MARTVGFMVIIFIVVLLINRGVFSLGQFAIACAVLLVVGLVLGQMFVVPWLARREPKHPRIQADRTWKCSLPPVEALERIRTALQDLDPTIESADTSLRVTVGSDVTFRRRGMGSDVGWRALPQVAIFRARPSDSGCQVTAEVRDNLGWYPDTPDPLIADELKKRNASVIERAVQATQSQGSETGDRS